MTTNPVWQIDVGDNPVSVHVVNGEFTQASVLDSAVWRVDAGTLNAGGDGLADLSGGGRDAVFGAGAAAPIVLPHDGENYIYKPVTAPTNRAIEASVRTGIPVGGTVRLEWDLLLRATPGWQSLYYTNGNSGVIYGLDSRKFRITFGGSSTTLSSTWQIPLNERGTLAVETDATTWTIYWNGAEVETGTFTTPGAFNGGVTSYYTIDGPYSSWDFDLFAHRRYINGALNDELVPNNSTDLSTITNTGSAGGVWAITRAATGWKIALVDRPLVLFGGAQEATVSHPHTWGRQWTVLSAWRGFSQVNPVLDFRGVAGGPSADHIGVPTISHVQTTSRATIEHYTGSAFSNVNAVAGLNGEKVVAARRSGTQWSIIDPTGTTSAVFADYPDNTRPGWVVGRRYDTPGLNGTAGEFIGAAVFDYSMSDAEIEQASAELTGEWTPREIDARRIEVQFITTQPTLEVL